jgi:hypothetical protein
MINSCTYGQLGSWPGALPDRPCPMYPEPTTDRCSQPRGEADVPHQVRIGVAGSAIALTLLAAACADSRNNAPSPATAAAPASTAPVPPSAGAQFSAEDAESIALETVGSGQVLNTEVDDMEIEVQVWEVTVVTAEGLHRKVTVDMTSGSILGDEVDD